MNLQLIDLPADYLNPDALLEWRDTFLSMDAWMRAVLIGLFALLAGACLLEWLWGLRMHRFARFITGFTLTFFPVFLVLMGEYDIGTLRAMLYALGAGAAGGLLNAFLLRVFRFLEGAVLGAVVFHWALPAFLKIDVYEDSGRIWLLVLSLALGVLFALLAKKFAFLETAVVGGCVLGLLLAALVPFERIPFLSEKLNLSEEQFRMYLPGVLAGVGALLQLLQWAAARRKEKALAIPAGEAEEDEAHNHWEEGETPADQPEEEETLPEEGVSFARAEEVLVEKAHELAQAAARSAETERIRERCSDVAEGLYTPEVGAQKLGLTQEQFLEQMKRFGFVTEEAEEEQAEEEQTEETAAEEEQAEEIAAEEEQTKAEESETPDEETEEQHGEG